MKPLAIDVGQVLPLTRALRSSCDPLALYAALCDHGRKPETMLLESADANARAGLRSVLITDAALVMECADGQVLVEAKSLNGQNALEALARAIEETPHQIVERGADHLLIALHALRGPARDQLSERERQQSPGELDPLRCMATCWKLLHKPSGLGLLCAGVFSYDLLGCYESLPQASADPLQYPDYRFILPEAMIVLDHARESAQALCFVFGGEHREQPYHDAAQRLAGLVRAVEVAPKRTSLTLTPEERALARLSSPGQAHVDVDDERFGALVVKLKEHILAGDIFQAVASRTFSVPCSDALAAYGALRRLNPSPYMFYLSGQPHTLFGASPETCLKVSADPERAEVKLVEICPIAGTRRRGEDAEEDARAEAELRMDTKELAEHMMLVDLARNDIARVSVAGTRKVERLLSVERYSHVMHLVSQVRGQLKPELDALHAYVASMNMGTLVGAPKLRAAQLIGQYEATKRGPYGGAVGYLSASGELDTAIIIRSALVRGQVAAVRAGAGVVHDSDPAAEADETTRKAAAVLQAIALSQALLARTRSGM